MDQRGGRGQGEVERKAYYGGRTEFSYDGRPSRLRLIVTSALALLFCSSYFVLIWIGHHDNLKFVVLFLASFVTGSGIVQYRAYHAWKKRPKHYYDVMSAYPKVMMTPLTKEEKAILFNKGEDDE